MELRSIMTDLEFKAWINGRQVEYVGKYTFWNRLSDCATFILLSLVALALAMSGTD